MSLEGWRTVAREFAELLERIDQLQEQEAAKLNDDPHAERVEATVVMMRFESSLPNGFDADAEGALSPDEVEDLAPPGQ